MRIWCVYERHPKLNLNHNLKLTVTVRYPFSTKPDETERNLTKPNNYCRQMCYKNASNSNKSIPLSMVMRMDNVGNV